MNASFQRIALYLTGGGLLLVWLDPPAGIMQYILIAGLILAFAYLDSFIARRSRVAGNNPKVISMGAFRARQKHRAGTAAAGRERRVLRPAYSSAYHSEVDALLQILRSDGLNPMMVTQNRSGAMASPVYMIMLPEKELRQAKPLIDLYVVQSAKAPS